MNIVEYIVQNGQSTKDSLKTIFDQYEIKLKYYNQSNEHIVNEYIIIF